MDPGETLDPGSSLPPKKPSQSSDRTVAPPATSLACPAAAKPSTEASNLPGYQLIRPIGRGGMGVVWLATQLATRRSVALKIVGGQFAGLDANRARFEREVQLSARLEHPNVARVYDSGVANGVCFYAMELIEGPDLEKFVKSQSSDDDAIVGLMVSVCRGVQHAHQRGIIHRDLKPGNVLIGPDAQPKVTDFGLAKLVQGDPSGGLGAITIEGSASGTPGYMAPEQARGEDDHMDTRSDVFSLGAMLFTLLCGKPAYDLRGTLYEVIQRIAESEPQRPRSARADLDSELEAIIAKAMSFTPESRYGSAGELADELQRYLDGSPILARKQTTVYLLSKTLKKHRLKFGLVAATVAMAIGGIAYSNFLIVKQRNEAVIQRDRAVVAETSAVEQRDRAITAERAAQAARTQAEANLAVANSAVSQFLERIGSRSLANVPGVLPLRQMLMSDAIAYYRQLLAKSPDDRGIMESLANVLQTQGELSAEAQDWKHAIDSMQESLEIVKTLPNQNEQNRRIAALMGFIAQYTYRGGDSKTAALHAENAKKVAEQMSDASSSDSTLQKIEAVNKSLLSESYRSSGQIQKAIDEQLANIEKLEAQRKTSPYDMRALAILGYACSSLADLYTDAGRHDDMVANSQKSTELLDKVRAARSNDYKARTYYARSFSDWGQRETAFERFDDARVKNQKAVDLYRQDLATSTDAAGTRLGLGRALSEIGRTWLDQGKFEMAESSMKESMDMYEKLAAGEPGLGEGTFGLAYQLTLYAECEAGLSRAKEANDSLLRSADLAAKIHPNPEENRRSRQLYSRLYTAQAVVMAKFDQKEASLAAVDRAAPMLEQLGGSNFKLKRELARLNAVRSQYGLPAAPDLSPTSRPTDQTDPVAATTRPARTTTFASNDSAGMRAALGTIATVHGPVSTVTRSRTGGVTFIHFKGNRISDFIAVIYASRMEAITKDLKGSPKDVLEGKIIKLTGQISDYKGQPQIEINRADQIQFIEEPSAH